MKRNANVRFVKPMLEQLEARVQPSFLLAGAVQQQFLPPLQAMLTDMQTAKGNLANNFTMLTTPGKVTNVGDAETQYAAGAANFSQMVSDQHAINATVTADNAFIRAAAMAEFTEGDPTDLILVTFGPLIGFNPTSSLTNVQTQANSLINGSDVQTWISKDFTTIPTSFISSPVIWDSLVAPRTF
ncbi:MAG TPA: hypothetical protein VH643_00130 [Gemmataceae bacterium]|jgi:hypothetical protein